MITFKKIANQAVIKLLRRLSAAIVACLALYTLAVVFILKDFSVSILILMTIHGVLFSSILALTYQKSIAAAKWARFIFVVSCMTLITLLSLLWHQDTGLQQFLLVGMITSGFLFSRREKNARRMAEYGYAALYLMVEGTIVFNTTHTLATLRLANAIILVVSGIILLRLVRSKIERQAEALMLSEKKNRSLLRSMLPSAPGAPNEHWPLGHTEKIDNVSVLFADFQGYTTLSETYDDTDIVHILDDCYHLFDAHALRFGIEKIKTNGDEYMAAIGVPLTYLHTPDEDANQTVTMCLFAKALLRSFNSLVEKRNLGCNIRIGIATGSVTGGIIGGHKPQFDIWGKTVNRASRLEQASRPGTITVCARTRGQILDNQTDTLAFSESFVVGDNLVAHTLLMENL